MSKITYEIVRHDGGWAYRVDETFSESFTSHDAARKAAELAAKEQALPGDSVEISFEDKQGKWHSELASGKDRPEVDVEG
jgi:predicted secreted protein